MRHNAIAAHTGYWGTSTNGLGCVFVQLQDACAEQVRVPLDPDEALRFAEQLVQAAARAKLERAQMEGVVQKAMEAGALSSVTDAAPDDARRLAQYAEAVQVLSEEVVEAVCAGVRPPIVMLPSEKVLSAALRAAVMGWDDALECMELAGMHADSNYIGAKAAFRQFSEQHAAPVWLAQKAAAAEHAARRTLRPPVRRTSRRPARAAKAG